MHPLIPDFEPLAIPIVGDITVHGFGILVASGFILGSKMSMRKAERQGLDPEVINRLVGWLVAGVFIGGHLGHVFFYEPKLLKTDPMQLLRVWDGLSSYGGFIACTLVAIFFFRYERKKRRIENHARQHRGEGPLPAVSFWPYADLVAYGLPLGWAMGRYGCFSAHDHAGTPTDFWLGVYGMCPDLHGDLRAATACHDLGLYEALWSTALFLVFMVLDKKPRFQGFYVGWLATSYAPFRFFLDFFRASDARYFGFTPAQYGSLAMLAIGVWVLMRQKDEPPVLPPEPAPEPEPAS